MEFCILILYPANLINSLISSTSLKSFFSIPSDILQKGSYDLWIKTVLLLPFPSGYLLFPLLALLLLIYIFSKMLNRKGKTKHPCLVLDLRRKPLALSPLITILVVDFPRCPLSDWGSSHILSLIRFLKIRNGYWIYKMCFLHLW